MRFRTIHSTDGVRIYDTEADSFDGTSMVEVCVVRGGSDKAAILHAFLTEWGSSLDAVRAMHDAYKSEMANRASHGVLRETFADWWAAQVAENS